MFLIGSEQRESHRFLEKAQADLDRILNSEDVVEGMEAHEVELLQEGCQSLFIPNFRHNTLAIPRKYRDTDMVPMVGVRRGADIGFDETAAVMTPSQQTAHVEWLKSVIKGDDNDKELLSDDFFGAISASLVSKADESKCSVGSSYGLLTSVRRGLVITSDQFVMNPLHVQVDARPAIALRLSKDYYEPLTLAHEIVHAKQMIDLPQTQVTLQAVRAEDRRRELEAYHYSGQVGGILLRGVFSGINPENVYIQHMQDHAGVENDRNALSNIADPFDPTPALLEKLAEKGYVWAAADYRAAEAAAQGITE